MSEKESRAEKEGEQLGKNIVETADLMYRNNTETYFFKGLYSALKKYAGNNELKEDESERGHMEQNEDI